MKILITTPPLQILAGVSSHYNGLKSYFSDGVMYFSIGYPKWRTIFSFWYYLKFIFVLLKSKPDVVLVNPSMASTAIKRDFGYLKIARALNVQTAVMFHGFHIDNVKGKESNIASVLNKTCCILVLANEFRMILQKWGVKVPIELTTTKVDDKLLDKFLLEKKKQEVSNILYLARTTKEKGIFIFIETCLLLHNQYPNLKFTVVGDGVDLEKAKNMARPLGSSIRFTGGLSGDKLITEFVNADLYLFTSYHEGMPTSVLEAMAFGLPVITRPVGGLVDFFTCDMGSMVDSFNPVDFAKVIGQYIEQPDRIASISWFNHKYACEHFLASKVARKMEGVLKSHLK